MVHSSCLYPATCRSINDKANADNPPENGMMVNYADFNVGFQPTVWQKICKATAKPIFQPLEDAIELLKPDSNFVQQSNRLAYTEGDMWFYLKAEERRYCQALLEVRGMAASVHTFSSLLKCLNSANERLFRLIPTIQMYNYACSMC